MAAAAGAVVFGARKDELEIPLGLDVALDGCVETRPPGAAVELRLGAEQFQSATGADVSPLAVLLVQRAGKRPLRSFPAQNLVLLRRQHFSPLLVRSLELLDGAHRSRHSPAKSS